MIEMSGMRKTNVLMGHVVEVVMWVVMRLVGLVSNVVGGQSWHVGRIGLQPWEMKWPWDSVLGHRMWVVEGVMMWMEQMVDARRSNEIRKCVTPMWTQWWTKDGVENFRENERETQTLCDER